ncbi:PGPGW domain-containing protein [Nocardioides limicola]|uniref:PGPGW domain-containing protein n=1 Tax=Nocardioides limicola TaxID=2803368 RepID=UPI00193B1B59|nr:PGPGW domain-containing protein [Nocardioides sp. DJM-14]
MARPRWRDPVRYRRLHALLHSNPLTGLLTKVVVTLVGTLVVLLGVVMLVTPGPGLVTIVVGLLILSAEWEWARRWLRVARTRLQQAALRAREMDPALRLRRLIHIGSATIAVTAVAVVLVIAFGWPESILSAWSWAQQHVAFLPDLPGR